MPVAAADCSIMDGADDLSLGQSLLKWVLSPQAKHGPGAGPYQMLL